MNATAPAKSLKKRLAWQIGLLFMLVVGSSTLVVGWLLQHHLEQESRDNLSKIASRELRRLEDRVSYLLETTQTLTSNPFIINGLIDPDGRQTYLPKLVENFAKNRDVASFTLVDFDGRPVFASMEPTPDYNSFPQLRKALAMGSVSLFISPQQHNLMVVSPIDYYNTTQGAVVVEFDFKAILERLNSKDDTFSSLLRDPRGVILALSEHADTEMITTRVAANPKEMPWLHRLELELELGVPASIHQASIARSLMHFGSLELLFLFLTGWISIRIGNSIATPILTLCQRVARRDGAPCAPIGTRDELEILAETFDQQTTELRTNQEELEQRVELRTVELSQSRQLLMSVLDAIPSRVFWKNLQGYYLGGNPAFARDAGLQEMVVRRDEELPWKEQANALAQMDQKVIQSGEPMLGLETDRITVDGHHLWIRLSKVPLRSPHGDITGVLGVYEDITNERDARDSLERSNRELNESRFLLEWAQEIAHLGHWRWNLQDNSHLWSREVFRIFGLEPIQSPDSNLYLSCVHPDDRNLVLTTMERVIVMAETDFYIEHKVVRPNGELRHVMMQGAVAVDDQGKPIHFLGTVQDITERKQSERDLVEARLAAENANRAKSEFLANMSHEIRTPLNAVINFSHLLQETNLSAKQNNYVTKVEAAGRTLLGIINDILDFSKLEAERLELESIPFNLEDMVGNVAGIAAVRRENKHLELLYHIRPEVPCHLHGDPLRLGQVLTNLMVNAVKFTESGEVILKVERETSEGNKVWLRFSVRDTGIGITPDQQNKLFRSFSQADASTSRRFGGTGLGLAISQRLVELMGGCIQVESEPGQGSTFYFTIPLEEGMEELHPTMVAPELAGLHALVVDDNASAREMMQNMLESFRMKVTLANDGQQALQLLEDSFSSSSSPFQIIFLDQIMPNMDGLETARRIRAMPQCAHTPELLMITAHGRDELAREAGRIGMNGFLTKPFSPSMLLEAIQEARGGKARPLRTRKQLLEGELQVRLKKIRGARVLLVEDNTINQEVAIELLAKANLRVTAAQSGEQALQLIQEHPFDLVLMDIQMPGMDGQETTRRIRGIPSFQEHPPILAMTANALAGDREKSLAVGMQDHLGKPIDPQALYMALLTWIPEQESTESEESSSNERSPETTGITIPKLAGVTTHAGLDRVGGNHALYLRLLRRFRAEQGSFMAELEQLLNENNRENAFLRLHTLKGNAGNLGMEGIHKAAQQLEHSLQGLEHAKSLKKSLSTLEQALEQVLRGLSALPEEVAPPPSVQSMDRDKVLTTLKGIIQVLDQDFAKAMDGLDQLRTLLSEGPLYSLLMNLSKAMDEFDTDRSRDLLLIMQATLEKSLE